MARRIRRSPEEARQRILSCAERLLIEGGPEAVRVQVIARELGVTDAAVHHHFGSRERLLESLVRYGAKQLSDALAGDLARWAADEVDFESFASQVLDTMERKGYARLVMWLALSGWSERGSGMFEGFVEALHARRTAHDAGRGADREETAFLATVLLMTLIGEPLFGTTARRSVGLKSDRRTTLRFRRWLLRHMHSLADGQTPASGRALAGEATGGEPDQRR